MRHSEARLNMDLQTLPEKWHSASGSAWDDRLPIYLAEREYGHCRGKMRSNPEELCRFPVSYPGWEYFHWE